MTIEEGFCFVKPDGTYMARYMRSTHIGYKHCWYEARSIEQATIFPYSKLSVREMQEEGYPRGEPLNAVSVKVTRTVELTGYGVKE